MYLRIEGPDGSVKDDVRAFLEDRVISKLSRVSKAIRAIEISIRDVNGPRGGVDHLLLILVRLESGGEVVVRHRAPDVHSGAAVALERTIRAVRRELQRRRSVRREAYRRNLAVGAP